MAGSPEIADLLDLDRPLGETVRLVAERKSCAVGDVMVVVLDRPRHEQGIAAIREAGARVRLIAHGDVSAALLAVTERSPGGPAVGHRRHARGSHLGGGRQVPRRPAARAPVAARRGRAHGRARGRLRPRAGARRATTWSAGEDVFFSATGITDGDVLQGVRYPSAGGATTESLVTRTRSGTIRRITRHARSRQAAPSPAGATTPRRRELSAAPRRRARRAARPRATRRDPAVPASAGSRA